MCVFVCVCVCVCVCACACVRALVCVFRERGEGGKERACATGHMVYREREIVRRGGRVSIPRKQKELCTILQKDQNRNFRATGREVSREIYRNNARVCVRESERVRKREGEIVCVARERERGTTRARVCVCVRERERERESVCL